MSMEQIVTVVDQDGIQGTIDTREFEDQTHVVIVFPENRRLSIPKSILTTREDGIYSLPLRTAHLQDETQIVVFPVIQEDLQVQKQSVETGKVRLTKTVHEEQTTINESVMQERVDVERVPVNRYVDAATEARREGETLIIPVFEEVLVVEKRLLLREEIHVTPRKETKEVSQEVTVRREDITVERTDTPQSNL
jgi:uncharacterized protein (TIGR02271 family)